MNGCAPGLALMERLKVSSNGRETQNGILLSQSRNTREIGLDRGDFERGT